jgi:hypothetical protein
LERTSKKLSNFHGIALPFPNKAYSIAHRPVSCTAQPINGWWKFLGKVRLGPCQGWNQASGSVLIASTSFRLGENCPPKPGRRRPFAGHPLNRLQAGSYMACQFTFPLMRARSRWDYMIPTELWATGALPTSKQS